MTENEVYTPFFRNLGFKYKPNVLVALESFRDLVESINTDLFDKLNWGGNNGCCTDDPLTIDIIKELYFAISPMYREVYSKDGPLTDACLDPRERAVERYYKSRCSHTEIVEWVKLAINRVIESERHRG